jgi:hypothetical protein
MHHIQAVVRKFKAKNKHKKKKIIEKVIIEPNGPFTKDGWH